MVFSTTALKKKKCNEALPSKCWGKITPCLKSYTKTDNLSSMRDKYQEERRSSDMQGLNTFAPPTLSQESIGNCPPLRPESRKGTHTRRRGKVKSEERSQLGTKLQPRPKQVEALASRLITPMASELLTGERGRADELVKEIKNQVRRTLKQ